MPKSSLTLLSERLVEKHHLDPATADNFVKNLLEVINQGLQQDKVVKIKGWGTLKVIHVHDRESVDVNTGERIVIEGRDKLTFTPESVLKEIVNKPFEQFETVVVNDGVDFDSIDQKFADDTSLEGVNDDEGGDVDTEENPVPSAEGLSKISEDRPEISTPEKAAPVPDAPESEDLDEGEKADQTDTESPAPSSPILENIPQEKAPFLKETGRADAPTQEKPEVKEPVFSLEDDRSEKESVPVVEKPESKGSTFSLEDDRTVQEKTPTANEQEVKEPVFSLADEDSPETDTPNSEEQDVQSASVSLNEKQSVKENTPIVDKQNEEEEPSAETEPMPAKEQVVKTESSSSQEDQTAQGTTTITDKQGHEETPLSTDGSERPRQHHIGHVSMPSYLIFITAFLFLALIAGLVGLSYQYGRLVSEYNLVSSKIHHLESAVSMVPSKPAPKPRAQKRVLPPSAPKTDTVAKRPQSKSFPSYDSDPRVRTGAYRIIGIDKVVTVKKGQTISGLSRTYLGNGMECYVEAVNGITEVKEGQKVRIPKLELKKRR